MTVDEYVANVIDLFQHGEPTETQWRQMAWAVLWASEHDDCDVSAIDKACDPGSIADEAEGA